MSWYGDVIGCVLKAHELYATVNLRLDQVQKDTEELAQEVAVLRRDLNDVSHRVVRLEEARNAIDAQVEAKVSTTMTKVIADMQVAYAQSMADSAVKAAQAQASAGAPQRPELLPPTTE